MLFGHLSAGDKKTHDPINFFCANKDYDGTIPDMGEQKDADEFLNIFMDKIENNCKGDKSYDYY